METFELDLAENLLITLKNWRSAPGRPGTFQGEILTAPVGLRTYFTHPTTIDEAQCQSYWLEGDYGYVLLNEDGRIVLIHCFVEHLGISLSQLDFGRLPPLNFGYSYDVDAGALDVAFTDGSLDQLDGICTKGL